MSNSEQTPSTDYKFSISRIVCQLLKLGNGGKVDSFLTRVIKTLNKEITILKKNLDVAKFTHEQKLEDLQDKLEDARESLEASYLNIDVDRIATNEGQKDYEEVYLDNIEKHLLAVKAIEKDIEDAIEAFESKSKNISEDIESRQVRISAISAQ